MCLPVFLVNDEIVFYVHMHAFPWNGIVYVPRTGNCLCACVGVELHFICVCVCTSVTVFLSVCCVCVPHV